MTTTASTATSPAADIATHAVAWFEIPAADIGRAQAFYERLLQTTLRLETIGDHHMAVFPAGEGAATGCILAGADVPAPSATGTLVYLAAGDSLDTTLARVEGIGGRITTPKVRLPGDLGVFAHIADSEGNRVGLHAPH